MIDQSIIDTLNSWDARSRSKWLSVTSTDTGVDDPIEAPPEDHTRVTIILGRVCVYDTPHARAHVDLGLTDSWWLLPDDVKITS